MRILCIIPVRGGSKGLPRKNALEINKGKSLLEWTIIQANMVFQHEDIIVSTEDNELSVLLPLQPQPCNAPNHQSTRPSHHSQRMFHHSRLDDQDMW